MGSKRICVAVRHPTFKEGQTAFARGFLKVLKMLYGNELLVIDTAKHDLHNKYLLYLYEFVTILNKPCDTVHVLNLNKPLISIIGSFRFKELITYQFSYLPEIHNYWRVKRTLIEHGSKLVIGTSRRIAELFSNGFFTYPPVDTELFRPRDKVVVRRLLGLPTDKVIIGYVGDVDVNRGFNIVAKLAAELGGNDIKFLIAYLRVDNVTRDMMVNIKRTLERNALIVRRTVPIWYIYNAVDVLLLPIRNSYPTEPPATLLEALASGTPVIGGPSPSMDDYVGLYIRVKDDDYLGSVKQAIDVKRIELNELGIRGREFATKKLSYQAILQNLKLVME
jgi:glycosyltransferase involved in cell wall biosynthesis